MQFVMSEREANIDQYRADFMAGIESLDSAIASARSGMSGAFAAQRQLLEAGFQSSKDEINSQFAASRGQMVSRNAFSGMGNTSFGQSMVDALGTERAKQIGLVDERQRMAQVELEGQQAAMRNQFELAAGGAQLNARSALAAGTLGGMQAYGSQYGNLLAALGSQAANTYGGIAELQSGLGTNLARNVGSGFNLGSALIGGGLAAVTGGLGSVMTGGTFFGGMGNVLTNLANPNSGNNDD